MEVTPFPDDVNCEIDGETAPDRRHGIRASDLIIGAAILAPAAVTMAKEIREIVTESSDQAHKSDAA